MWHGKPNTALQCDALRLRLRSRLSLGVRHAFQRSSEYHSPLLFSLVESRSTGPRCCGIATRENGFAGLTAPVGVALLLVSFLGGTEPASTPYLAPGCGLRGALATWLFPPMCPISFALPDPIQGQSATSLRTDDLFYTATARGGLVFTQPCLLQELCGDRRSDHPAPLCFAAG